MGKPILPCIFKETSHYSLCDLGTKVNVISYDFYLEIKEEIEPAIIENTDITIMLANKNLRIPMGVVEDATITIGNKKILSILYLLICQLTLFSQLYLEGTFWVI